MHLPPALADRVNILVVDDLPEQHVVLRCILDELGQNVVSAYSGREALRCVLEEEFAVILLDVDMPDMDGFATADLIRQYRRTANTPILFVTTQIDDIQAARGYALGAVDYIAAPIVPDVLRSKVRVFVDLHRLNRELREQAVAREALVRAESARGAAEAASRRADFLAGASRILAQTLDLEATIDGLLAVSCPELADVCLFVRVDEALAPSHVRVCNQPVEGGGRNLFEADPQLLDLPVRRSVAAAIKRRDLVLLWGQMKLAQAWGGGANGASRRTMAQPTELDAASGAALPVCAGECPLGALVLVTAWPRTFGSAETALAREVVSRASIAMENANLYRLVREADLRKNEFLAMLAHELRNPPAPIRNAVHILQGPAATPENIGWAREVIGRQIDHMARLIDDLLDVSRIARGKVSVSTDLLTLANVIDHALETSRPLLEERQHQFHLTLPDAPVVLRGDLLRLAQVVSNLLNNAAKFTPQGGQISLAASVAGAWVRIAVKDSGQGIDAHFLPRIFDLFSQADQSLARSEGGLGIGLTLVKHLVELHGGEVVARSEGPGRGAEFVVTLPLERDSEMIRTAGLEGGGSESEARASNILVVDDLAASAESLQRLLELEGHRVRTAADGRAALAVAAKFRPEVVILDVGLPGMSGYQVARALRQDPDFAGTLLIAVTGYGRGEDRGQALESGCDHHFVKPADVPRLLSIISTHLALKRFAQLGRPSEERAGPSGGAEHQAYR